MFRSRSLRWFRKLCKSRAGRTADSGDEVPVAVIGNDIAALTSVDGLNWTCVGDGPMFRAQEVPGSNRVHTVAAAFDGTRLSVIVEALFDDAQVGVYSNLWLANSTP